LIAPVDAFKESPDGLELYVPPTLPVRVTLAVLALLQYGEPLYVIVALGAAVIVTEDVVLKTAQPPLAGIV
jgi:hypothetical protein